MFEGAQSPLEQEGGFLLLAGDKTDDVFVQSRRNCIGVDVRHKSVLILLADEVFNVG
jgi:hypothetical protein